MHGSLNPTRTYVHTYMLKATTTPTPTPRTSTRFFRTSTSRAHLFSTPQHPRQTFIPHLHTHGTLFSHTSTPTAHIFSTSPHPRHTFYSAPPHPGHIFFPHLHTHGTLFSHTSIPTPTAKPTAALSLMPKPTQSPAPTPTCGARSSNQRSKKLLVRLDVVMLHVCVDLQGGVQVHIAP